ncbi:MAG: chromosome partitioning protein, ParB family [Parcubacteria group bacterium Gr01-1014_70]|nr:MAG: chromosome partitioning protein, ParB family [Parcubacteria group bacterium Gr01-1014_70]
MPDLLGKFDEFLNSGAHGDSTPPVSDNSEETELVDAVPQEPTSQPDDGTPVVAPETPALPQNKTSAFLQNHSVKTQTRGVSEKPKESVFWIETAKIKPNPEQPRTTFDEEKIRALAESIRQYGVLQPIVVSKRELDVPSGTQVEYQIIAGERRFRAALSIGLTHMPAVIRREESDRIKLELALIENLQREDLQPLEKAQAYKRLVNEFGLNTIEVGLRVGKSREAVSNTMRLLLLPAYAQQALVAGELTEGQARPLITLTHSPEEQRFLFHRIVSEGLGAREIEQAARQIAVRAGIAVREPRKKEEHAPNDLPIRQFETKLADVLGTRVSVKRTREGKGKISIEFFSNEELQNLLSRMAALQPEKKEEPEDSSDSVLIHPLTQEPAEGAARPEDLTTFTV